MSDLPEKLDLASLDIAEERRRELLRLFPEVATEAGRLDFERLKLALGEAVDVGRERYGMNWPGKADCFKTLQTPSLGTLRPCAEESVDFDSSENLIIEGDNLEVLKLLQKAYLGKVKMIYIDPPYNTGNDFIYPDNYSESLATYLEYTGQVDAEGRKFGTNTDTDGRFHSKWLNMMYPRLYLARNLLREDGVIFVSIDDVEATNLRVLLNDVFGESNFVANLLWQKRYVSNATAKYVSDMHDHIMVYAKSVDALQLGLTKRTEEQLKDYKNPDDDPRGPWRAQDLSASKPYQAGLFEIIGPTGVKFSPPPNRYWRCNQETYEAWLADDRITFGKERTARPMLKAFLAEAQEGIRPNTWWEHKFAGHNKEATLEMKALFDGESPFDTPKPSKLVQRMVELLADKDCVALDFFAGSGTTAHAVLDLNKQDGGKRKFILVQLPEPTGRDDYPTIADITKERVRRVIRKLNDADEAAAKVPAQLALSPDPSPAGGRGEKADRGFRVFKLAESNFKPWNAETPKDAEALTQQLELHIDHIREGRSAEDLLYEILLKSGFRLTTPIETLMLAGKTVHSVSGGALFICLERELTLELVRAMAAQNPQRVVCLDEGFAGNDQLKTNAVQIFKTQGVTSFKTV